MKPISKRLDNLEGAFLKTLAKQIGVNKRIIKRLGSIERRLCTVEDQREGKSCIGFIENDGPDEFLVGM